ERRRHDHWFGRGFRRSAIGPASVQRPGRAVRHDLRDLLSRLGGGIDPGPATRVERRERAADTRGEMDAVVGLPGHLDAVALVHPLDCRLVPLLRGPDAAGHAVPFPYATTGNTGLLTRSLPLSSPTLDCHQAVEGQLHSIAWTSTGPGMPFSSTARAGPAMPSKVS